MRLNHSPKNTGLRAAGFTLIEVLLTLVILAVGLLGLAGMQVIGLKSGSTASYRSIATQVAEDMAERMRANPQALGAVVVDKDGNLVADQSYESLFKNVSALHPSASCDALPDPYCGSWMDGTNVMAAAGCSYSQMAAYDINVMYCGNAKSASDPSARTVAGIKMLPKGTMAVTCAAIPCWPGSQHLITVSWEERSQGAAAASAGVQRSLVLAVTTLRTSHLPGATP